MTSYNSQTGNGGFLIQFETDNKEHYETVQKLIRTLIDTEVKENCLPCPFCGGRKSVAVAKDTDSLGDPLYRITCSALHGGCDASTGWADDKYVALRLWNQRADK